MGLFRDSQPGGPASFDKASTPAATSQTLKDLQIFQTKPPDQLNPRLVAKREWLQSMYGPLLKLREAPMDSLPPELQQHKLQGQADWAAMDAKYGLDVIHRRINEFLRANGEDDWIFDRFYGVAVWDQKRIAAIYKQEQETMLDMMRRKPSVCAKLMAMLVELQAAGPTRPSSAGR